RRYPLRERERSGAPVYLARDPERSGGLRSGRVAHQMRVRGGHRGGHRGHGRVLDGDQGAVREGIMKPWAKVGSVVLAVAILGCKSAPTPAEAAKLEGTTWVLASDVPEGAKPATLMLQADGHKVVGFTGCNRMFGQYTLD